MMLDEKMHCWQGGVESFLDQLFRFGWLVCFGCSETEFCCIAQAGLKHDSLTLVSQMLALQTYFISPRHTGFLKMTPGYPRFKSSVCQDSSAIPQMQPSGS